MNPCFLRLLDNEKNPTTIQSGDIIMFRLVDGAMSIGRNSRPGWDRLLFAHGPDDRGDDRLMFLRLYNDYTAYRNVVRLIAGVTGLTIEPDTEKRLGCAEYAYFIVR